MDLGIETSALIPIFDAGGLGVGGLAVGSNGVGSGVVGAAVGVSRVGDWAAIGVESTITVANSTIRVGIEEPCGSPELHAARTMNSSENAVKVWRSEDFALCKVIDPNYGRSPHNRER